MNQFPMLSSVEQDMYEKRPLKTVCLNELRAIEESQNTEAALGLLQNV